jgi:hypothetical protein
MKKWIYFKVSQGLMVSPSPAWADSSHPWTAGMFYIGQPVYDSDFKGRLCDTVSSRILVCKGI